MPSQPYAEFEKRNRDINRLIVPEIENKPPAAGLRVRDQLPQFKSTEIYHSLYLPTDWKSNWRDNSQRYPVIFLEDRPSTLALRNWLRDTVAKKPGTFEGLLPGKRSVTASKDDWRNSIDRLPQSDLSGVYFQADREFDLTKQRSKPHK